MRRIILLFIVFLMIFFPSIVFARSHPYFILDIAVSSEGRYVAVSRIDDKLVLLYDLQYKKILNVFTSKYGMQSSVSFTPDGRYFVFQNAQHELLFYDTETGKIANKYQLDRGAYSLAFFRDNNRFIWGSSNGKIEYVDIKKGEKIQLKPPVPEKASIGFEAPILHIVISSDEKYFLTTTFTDGEYALRPEPDEDFKLIKKGKLVKGHWDRDPVTGKSVPHYAPDRYEIRHLGLNLWDAETLKKIKKLGSYFVTGQCWPSFSPDSKYILAASEGGLAIFNTLSTEIYFEGKLITNGAAFISNTCYVRLASSDSHLTLFKIAETKDEVLANKKVINLKYAPCTGALATVPDKNLIITGDRDGSISVYKYNPEKMTIKLHWHPKAISAGLIRWLSPLQTMNLTETDIAELERRYEAEQKKVIEQDKRENKVQTPQETEY